MSVAASEFLTRITDFQTHMRFFADTLYASISVRLSLSVYCMLFRDIQLAGLFSAKNGHVFSASSAEIGEENTYTKPNVSE